MHVQSNNTSISQFIPSLAYICSYLSSYVGDMEPYSLFSLQILLQTIQVSKLENRAHGI